MVKLCLIIIQWAWKAETKQTVPKSKKHLVQNSCFPYNKPITVTNCKQKQVRKGYPLAGPSIAMVNTCIKKTTFLWITLICFEWWLHFRSGEAWNLYFTIAKRPPEPQKRGCTIVHPTLIGWYMLIWYILLIIISYNQSHVLFWHIAANKGRKDLCVIVQCPISWRINRLSMVMNIVFPSKES